MAEAAPVPVSLSVRFAKRSLHFVKVSPNQAMAMILHLYDRKSFTQKHLVELVRVLGKHLNTKMVINDSGRKEFPLKFVEQHSELDFAVSFSTSDVRFSYYFQDTYPKQFMLMPQVYIVCYRNIWWY